MAERIFHHYENLEEYHAGMWRIVRGSARKNFIASSADLMKDPSAFKDAMVSVLALWPKLCEANLTADCINRIAWLGHAGCCVACKSPEEATRVAWHTLALDEQREANRVADEVLQIYLRRQRANTSVRDVVDMMQ